LNLPLSRPRPAGGWRDDDRWGHLNAPKLNFCHLSPKPATLSKSHAVLFGARSQQFYADQLKQTTEHLTIMLIKLLAKFGLVIPF
jgi:hypothetical protein